MRAVPRPDSGFPKHDLPANERTSSYTRLWPDQEDFLSPWPEAPSPPGRGRPAQGPAAAPETPTATPTRAAAGVTPTPAPASSAMRLPSSASAFSALSVRRRLLNRYTISPITSALTAAARARGHELIVHVPMAPEGTENPGPNALYPSLPPDEIARRLNVVSSTVRLTLQRLAAAGLTWPLPAELTDTALGVRLFTAVGTKEGHRRHAEPARAAVPADSVA